LSNPNSYSPNPGQDPTAFGPQQEDIDGYKELLNASPDDLGFNPRVNAELTSGRIDIGSLGTFTNPDVGTAGLDQYSSLRLAQQRYIAAALGLRVGDTVVSANSHTASAAVGLPEASNLPPRPARLADGSFVAADARPVSVVEADAIYAGHFIAANRQHFSQPTAFEDLFRRVVEQAEDGKLEVKDRVGDTRGACSMVRQVARILGYEVGDFNKTADGGYVMPVSGIRPGFDSKFSHFKK
jgi:hypothetical protein